MQKNELETMTSERSVAYISTVQRGDSNAWTIPSNTATGNHKHLQPQQMPKVCAEQNIKTSFRKSQMAKVRAMKKKMGTGLARGKSPTSDAIRVWRAGLQPQQNGGRPRSSLIGGGWDLPPQPGRLVNTGAGTFPWHGSPLPSVLP